MAITHRSLSGLSILPSSKRARAKERERKRERERERERERKKERENKTVPINFINKKINTKNPQPKTLRQIAQSECGYEKGKFIAFSTHSTRSFVCCFHCTRGSESKPANQRSHSRSQFLPQMSIYLHLGADLRKVDP